MNSYDEVAPSPTSGSILVSLRKREYQTKQQQTRSKTPRRIGCPPRPQDQHPTFDQLVLSPQSSNDSDSNDNTSKSRTSARRSESSARLTSIHPLTPLTSLVSRTRPEADTSDSTMDWTASPSFSSFRPPSLAPSIGSLSKSFMSISQSMGFGGPSSSTSSSSCSTSSSEGLRNPRLFGEQMGGGDRRMSTPSIPTNSKQSSQPRFEDSTGSSSSSLSLCTNATTSQRPHSVYSVACNWISSSVTAPSLFASRESCELYNTNQPEPTPVSISYDSFRPDSVANYISARVPSLISEREYCVDGYDKVFAATWISEEELLFGTKCNKIMLLNTRTDRQVSIARLDECLLESSESVLSRIGDMASKVNSSGDISPRSSATPYKRPLGHSTVNNISHNLSNLEFSNSQMERNYRLFNQGRRSSTPSFPSVAGPSPATNTNNSPRNYFSSSLSPSMTSNSIGVRSLSVNPSRTLLAIGSGEPFRVTIYSLPELEPVGMMYGHTDLVFSLTWISDTVLATGSRDGSMRVWSMESPVLSTLPSASSRGVQVRLPEITRKDDKTRVRDLALNKKTGQLMTLSTDGFVKLWDRNSYKQLYKMKLKQSMETVCLASSAEANLFAVGSSSYVSVIDPRAPKVVLEAESCEEGCGVRSLDFKSHIITTGDGYGRIGFYDVRAQHYLDVFDDGETKRRFHDIGPGSLDKDTIFAGSIAGMAIRNAVYVMAYDSTGTRLFAAGGPIQLGLSGSYAGLWS
ncbi:DDB1- and CUL4-associated factor 12 [Mortierella sp. AM989]|nr:DDB1- and CUL4-associated factor 12 [Mortierella sp. AM989]